MVKYFLIILTIGSVFSSCKKSEDRSCFKSTGELKSIDYTFESFDTISLYDDIKYTLVPDTIFKVEVEGGENLIQHVNVIYENNALKVLNENKCNFLRSFKEKVEVKIHVQDLNYIHFEGSEYLISSDTLHASELRFFIRDGAGDVDLTVKNGYTSGVVSHGWGNFTLRGETIFAYLNCNTNSSCDTRLLKVTNELRVNSNTQGDMYVDVSETNIFEGVINQKGNIFYEGTPLNTFFTINNEGDIIDLNN